MNQLKAKSFDKFTSQMRERLESGDKKYGNDWYFTALHNEMKQELLDLANYAYLLYRKIELYEEELKKI